MEAGDSGQAQGVRVPDPWALALAMAGALVLAGSLAPWPMVDILHPFSSEPNGLWLHVDVPIFPAGVAIVAIGSRIELEAGQRRRPWASAGLSLIFLVVGLAVAYVSFGLFGDLSFEGWTSLLPVLAVFAGLAIIGSRIPLDATARRPRSIAMVLGIAALGALLLVRAPFLADDPEGWRMSFDGLAVGWLVGAVGAVIATVAAWRLRTQARLRSAS